MLNQKQRDHAIAMIKEKIDARKKEYRKPYPDPTDFLIARLLMIRGLKRGYTIELEELINREEHKVSRKHSWSNETSYFRPSDYKVDLFEIEDCGKAYKQACDSVDEMFEKATEELTQLGKDLENELMFGSDVEIITRAIERVESYGGKYETVKKAGRKSK
jgi:hypothetical protein